MVKSNQNNNIYIRKNGLNTRFIFFPFVKNDFSLFPLTILPRFHVLSTCPIVYIIINPKTIKRPAAIRRVHPHGRHHIRCNYLHPFFPSRHHPSLLFNMWCYGHIHSLLNEFLFCFFWSSLHLSASNPVSSAIAMQQ